jgi:hypothetical protein
VKSTVVLFNGLVIKEKLTRVPWGEYRENARKIPLEKDRRVEPGDDSIF